MFGNGEMVDCAYHAVEIATLMGKRIPVVKGASEPLVAGCGPAAHVHGTYARGPLGRLDLEAQIAPGYAANFILEQIDRWELVPSPRRHFTVPAIVGQGSDLAGG